MASMFIHIDQAQLAEALTWVAGCAPHITTTPILSGVLLTAADDAVSVSAFDFEVAATATVAAQVDQPGSVLVSARLLATIVKELPKGFAVTLRQDGSVLTVEAASGVFSLPLMPVEHYPQLPALPPQVGEVDAGEWATAARRAAVTAAKDDSMGEMTGVMLEFGDGLAVVSSDRYRLSASEIGWQPTLDGGELRPLLVPAASIAMTAIATGGTVGIHLDTGEDAANVVGFTTGGRQVVTRLLEGPKSLLSWRRFFSTPVTAEVTMPTSVLDAVLRRASTFVGNETTKDPAAVRLSFDDDQLTVTSGGNEKGTGSEVVPVDYTADPLHLVCKIAYLRDALKTAGTDRVSLSLADPTKPVVVRPVEDATFQHLVMPINPQVSAAAA